jgi:hypothetical protein
MPRSTGSTTEGDTEVTQEGTESKDAPFYCPGCGKRAQYQQQCTGKPESPHPPIEVVPTDELAGDPEKYTPAPSSENLG